MEKTREQACLFGGLCSLALAEVVMPLAGMAILVALLFSVGPSLLLASAATEDIKAAQQSRIRGKERMPHNTERKSPQAHLR